MPVTTPARAATATAARRDPLPLLLAAVRDAPHGPSHARGAAVGRVRGQRGRAVPQGLDGHRADRAPRAAHHSSGARPCHRRAAAGGLGGGARPGRRPSRHDPGRPRQRRRGRLRGRRADQREGLPPRQVRPCRPRHQPGRLQRPLVHELGGLRGQPRLRRRPRAALPARRRGAHRRPRARRLQPGRDDAPGSPPPRPAPGRRRPGGRRRPPADAHRGPGRRLPPARSGHRPRTGARRPAPGGRRRPRRRGVRRLPHDRLRRRARLGGVVVAGADRAGHRGLGRRDPRRSPTSSAAPGRSPC